MGRRKARKKRKQRKHKKKRRDPNALGASMRKAWRQGNQRKKEEKEKCREKISHDDEE
jgi:hypothetical protein